jgi:hypothetical protein
MNEPTRLRSDPSMPSGLRAALEEERRLPSNLDLSKLRASLLARASRPSSPPEQPDPPKNARSLAKLAALSALSFALGFGAHALTTRPPTAERVERTAAPAAIQPEPIIASTTIARAAQAPRPKPERAPKREAPPRAASPEPAASSLQDELRRYERAETAVRERRWDQAITEARAYLARYPEGELWRESEVALIEALLRSGGADAAEEEATRALAKSGIKDARSTILLLRAEARADRRDCRGADQDVTSAGALRASDRARVDAFLERCKSEGR